MEGKRFSRQREEIYQAVRGSGEHPSAQMVYDTLKPEMPRLSLGTVYRNLHQMAQEGRLTELDGPPNRFDAALHPHPHICCECCGRVADVEIAYDPALDRKAKTGSWTIKGHTLVFRGICPACAELF
ncbi:transcriptional repressor [Oscillibacter sp.]|uniref:Fur family transcriptional regulator n=1 Tax=Oscillibacter sp. TaxID=1945593 RepID=UPI00261CC837|nr:transcriptional repressor [Oscillibacter sp.]MDD3347694.1 transcriptional repressor [Oscillibacter sp.]